MATNRLTKIQDEGREAYVTLGVTLTITFENHHLKIFGLILKCQ